jgi:hypothetical protein
MDWQAPQWEFGWGCAAWQATSEPAIAGNVQPVVRISQSTPNCVTPDCILQSAVVCILQAAVLCTLQSLGVMCSQLGAVCTVGAVHTIGAMYTDILFRLGESVRTIIILSNVVLYPFRSTSKYEIKPLI